MLVLKTTSPTVSPSAPKDQPWTGYMGRLNQLQLELIAPDYMEREIFCCGPPPFMQAVRDILHLAGFDMEHYHEESFQAPITDESQAPSHEGDVVLEEAEDAELVFAASGASVRCRQTDTVLAAARASWPARCTWSTTAASPTTTSPRATSSPAAPTPWGR